MDDIAELNRLDRPKVVGISALSSGTIAKNMQDSGISEFITKPVDPHKLLESVKRSVMDSNTPD
ncbi:MAG: hypothetical protein U5N86_07780 [Planctomycetota bacterium]|nr:hypothetical protein [Planctomycetota bacterium]